MRYLALVAIPLLLAGCSLFQTPDETERDVQSQVPTQVLDPETNQVNDEAFEQQQQVSEDESLITIEEELEGTIIMEEDFSDLEL